MKVKIIQEENWKESINEYLAKYDNCQIADIKYTGCGTYAPYGITYYSAMIILNEP